MFLTQLEINYINQTCSPEFMTGILTTTFKIFEGKGKTGGLYW